MKGLEILLKTGKPEKDEKAIRQYIPQAVERLEEEGLIEGFHYFRYGGQVKFRLWGEKEEILQ